MTLPASRSSRRTAIVALVAALVLMGTHLMTGSAIASAQPVAIFGHTVQQGNALLKTVDAVAQKKSRITVKLVKKTFPQNKRAKVKIKVKVPGVARPQGVIKLTVGPYTYYPRMKKKHRGTLVFSTPYYLVAGKYKATAEYFGTAKVAGSKTKKAAKFRVKPWRFGVEINF